MMKMNRLHTKPLQANFNCGPFLRLYNCRGWHCGSIYCAALIPTYWLSTQSALNKGSKGMEMLLHVWIKLPVETYFISVGFCANHQYGCMFQQAEVSSSGWSVKIWESLSRAGFICLILAFLETLLCNMAEGPKNRFLPVVPTSGVKAK